MANQTISYTAPPVVASFIKDESFGRLIAGPVGSGKTTGCLFELFRRACEQRPAPDGLRYTRFAIVRQTLKQLKETVLKDILQWLEPVSHYKVTDSTIYIEVGDVRSEWLLIPLDDPTDQKRLLSMQLTGAWLSEAIEIDNTLIAAISGRCGRYPGANLGGATWMGMIADTNFPTLNTPWYDFMEVKTPPDWRIFKQPGGLTDGAENLDWLTQTPETLALPEGDPRRRAQGRVYYERLARNPNKDWVQRYVDALYGNDPSGTAVYGQTFKREHHVVRSLEPSRGHVIIVGQDFGRDPWSVICQLDHKGRLLVLEEVPAEDIGLELHLVQNLRPALMAERYLGLPIAIVGDPSGVAKNSLYEETSFDLLKRMGFSAFPAPTNDIDPRIRAVDTFLTSFRDGPGFLIDEGRCPEMVRGLGGGYRYAITKSGLRKPTPEKNKYSHGADALQYAALACLGQHGGMVTGTIMRRLRRDVSQTGRQRVSPQSWT